MLYHKHIIIIILNKRKWEKSIYYKEEYNEKKEMVIEIKLFNFFLLKVTFTNFCILYIWPGDFCL